MAKRSFIMKDGKPAIKKEGHRITIVPVGSKEDQIFRSDRIGFVEWMTCAFVRTYIPGEFDQCKLPKSLDLDEITHTFVIIAVDGNDGRSGEEHVMEHLSPLGETYKIVVFDMEGNMSCHARIPLLPEQAEIIRKDLRSLEK